MSHPAFQRRTWGPALASLVMLGAACLAGLWLYEAATTRMVRGHAGRMAALADAPGAFWLDVMLTTTWFAVALAGGLVLANVAWRSLTAATGAKSRGGGEHQ